MTTAEDIEKAIELLEEQKEAAVAIRDGIQQELNQAEARVTYYRDAIQGLRKIKFVEERNAIQGLRKMEIERERNG